MDVSKYTVKDATHLLACSHCCGGHRHNYTMPCVVLPSNGNKTKVLVFGDMYWKGKEHVKKIRYVNFWRIDLMTPREDR